MPIVRKAYATLVFLWLLGVLWIINLRMSSTVTWASARVGIAGIWTTRQQGARP